MLTLWNGYGIATGNVLATGAPLLTQTLRVLLQDVPQIPTRVQLLARARAVNLYVGGESSVWYAVDQDPGPIPSPSNDPLILVTDFRPGALLVPGCWQQCVLPVDSNPHELRFVSADPSVLVDLVMLYEAV